MKSFALSQWSFMRVLRLMTGVVGVFMGVRNNDPLLGLAGGFLLFMAFANTGCCGVNGCSVPDYRPRKTGSNAASETSFEEVSSPEQNPSRQR